jgi:small subunit ribosomal protein S2
MTETLVNNVVQQQEEDWVEITIQSLLESGAHFGSKKSLWNPKSAGYVYGLRNDIYIINLDTTISMWKKAKQALASVAENKGTVLFVGTKKKVRESVINYSKKCNSCYVHYRWLGGTLTNFSTLRKSVSKLERLESLISKAESSESNVSLSKKELLSLKKEVEKLNKYFGGLRSLKKLPDLIFVLDVSKDKLALQEANKLGIPVIALVDTDIDPSKIEYPIPANDDAISTQVLFLKAASKAVLEGQSVAKEVEQSQEKVKSEVTLMNEKSDISTKTLSDIPVEYKN